MGRSPKIILTQSISVHQMAHSQILRTSQRWSHMQRLRWSKFSICICDLFSNAPSRKTAKIAYCHGLLDDGNSIVSGINLQPVPWCSSSVCLLYSMSTQVASTDETNLHLNIRWTKNAWTTNVRMACGYMSIISDDLLWLTYCHSYRQLQTTMFSKSVIEKEG